MHWLKPRKRKTKPEISHSLLLQSRKSHRNYFSARAVILQKIRVYIHCGFQLFGEWRLRPSLIRVEFSEKVLWPGGCQQCGWRLVGINHLSGRGSYPRRCRAWTIMDGIQEEGLSGFRNSSDLYSWGNLRYFRNFDPSSYSLLPRVEM